jgi:hypothetical protein
LLQLMSSRALAKAVRCASVSATTRAHTASYLQAQSPVSKHVLLPCKALHALLSSCPMLIDTRRKSLYWHSASLLLWLRLQSQFRSNCQGYRVNPTAGP